MKFGGNPILEILCKINRLMVLSERETSDELFETLADWNEILKAQDVKPSPKPRGPRP